MNPESSDIFSLPPIATRKKGDELGSFIVNFVAIVILAGLLTGFVLVSSLVKKITKADAGLVVYSENRIGIDDGIGYMSNYAKLIEVRSAVKKGASLDEAIREAGYGK